ncbi:MAG: DNA polymerase III beta subunit (EC [uncultured Aureispira sp.]|uniref:Beta sliding clamp n=1 Tax=uncultured Aureispira sp. TaxID=1331704 RepID=A0A6S6TPX1_9BACT|nr:MAG: DNA polymerase III beta subunit (EC [uncultured Aureispira sp.]
MQFSISSADLKEQLQIINGAISSNPILPILEDFLFKIEGDTLTIAATDNQTFMTAALHVEADEDGCVAIPARILLDTLKQLPTQPLKFVIDLETFAVSVTSQFGQYKLAGEDGNDFPKIPAPNKVENIEVPATVLLEGINKTLFATSTNESQVAMTGVFVQINSEGLTFVATDAHKLVKYCFTDLDTELDGAFILPKKALNLLKTALSNSSQNVSLAYSDTNAIFRFENQVLSCRLIDENYPNYGAVIPSDNPNTMSITRSDFLNSLKRIANYANKTTNQVKLEISDSSLTIEAEDLDFSNRATEQLPCFYDGDAMTIGFNAKFLIEMLNTIGGDNVRIELSSPNRAGILRTEEQAPNEDLLMLVMPVMLNV